MATVEPSHISFFRADFELLAGIFFDAFNPLGETGIELSTV
jgi:hypothetical protein